MWSICHSFKYLRKTWTSPRIFLYSRWIIFSFCLLVVFHFSNEVVNFLLTDFFNGLFVKKYLFVVSTKFSIENNRIWPTVLIFKIYYRVCTLMSNMTDDTHGNALVTNPIHLSSTKGLRLVRVDQCLVCYVMVCFVYLFITFSSCLVFVMALSACFRFISLSIPLVFYYS